ncbi:MAG: DNA or RNA helicase of superfamily II, partial [Betaproteobacteria bacterium]|nr:DNA or RNA helicase of superfamily II [Betaproteobacteria bacterium]
QGLAEPEHCWCMTASFAPELFANLPESLMGKACICAPCARGDSA